MSKIGIIGGSGLDNPDLLQNAKDISVETTYGVPSSPLKEGTIEGKDVVLLARHGREHTVPPTFVNYRANIQALKDMGCDRILATTACGSLREEINRGHLVILDQFIDFTRRRPVSFYEEFEPHGAVHTGMADPFDEPLRVCSTRHAISWGSLTMRKARWSPLKALVFLRGRNPTCSACGGPTSSICP